VNKYLKIMGQKNRVVDSRTHIVVCGHCGAKTFSRLHAEFKKRPLMCPKCKVYFKWKRG
jgi:hypothetical protein